MSRLPRIAFLLPLVALGILPAAPVAAWEVSGRAAADDFRSFHRRFTTAAYAYPRHGAAPLGLTGFDVYADASYDRDFDSQGFVATAIDGDFTGGALSVGRVGARKGLPAGVDVGLAYGRALGGDVKLVSGELQWAILHGGVLEPALSLRLSGTRTVDAGAYRLDQLGAEVLVSKGFAVLTPYAGAGFVRSRGRLQRPAGFAGSGLESTTTRPVLFAGATLNLLLPKITVEMEKGEALQAALRVGIGF